MTDVQVISTLSRLTMPNFLQPTWELGFVKTDRVDLHSVKLTILTPCRDTGKIIEVCYTKVILAEEDSRMGAESMVLAEGWAMIQHLVLHEMQDHVLKDNKRWRDPHN